MNARIVDCTQENTIQARRYTRIERMIGLILDNREVLEKYEQGALVLNFKGCQVRAQLDKLAIDLEVSDNKVDLSGE